MSKAWEKQQSRGAKWTNLIVAVLDLQPNQTTKKATNAWAVGRAGQCRASSSSSRMRMRYNCYCTQCPGSDIHLRRAFPLAVCINSIRKPLATQTMHFKAHPKVTHDLTDNACLIRGKHISYISNMELLAVEALLFSDWQLRLEAPREICSSACISAKAWVLIVSWRERQARTGRDPCHDRAGALTDFPHIWVNHTTCFWH